MTTPAPPVDPRADTLRRLAEIGRALTYTRTMDEVLRVAVDRTTELLEADRGLVMLADESGGLRVRASTGVEAGALQRYGNMADETLTHRLKGLLGEYPAACFMGVPLVARGMVTGLLAVVRPGESPFGEEDEWLLLAAADPVAVALENARLEEEVRLERDGRTRAAQGADEAGDRALATLSHDLRSPLNAIDSYAELIEMEILGSVSDRQREALGRIRMSGRHLLAVLENVLEMTRLSAGVIRMHAGSVSVSTVVEEAVLMVHPSAALRDQSLVSGDVAEMTLQADPDRLRQVLVNLLGNAIKYTSPGGSIRVSTSTRDSDGLHWGTIMIADTGPGIPAEKLTAIFQPYYRLAGAEADAPEGVGLGLAISRELIRKMGGDIEVESELGHGCVFTVRLPRTA